MDETLALGSVLIAAVACGGDDESLVDETIDAVNVAANDACECLRTVDANGYSECVASIAITPDQRDCVKSRVDESDPNAQESLRCLRDVAYDFSACVDPLSCLQLNELTACANAFGDAAEACPAIESGMAELCFQ